MKTYRCACHLSFNPASKGCLRFDYPNETTTLNLETNSKQCWQHPVSTVPVTRVFKDRFLYIHICIYHVYIHIIQTRVGTLSSRILFHTSVKYIKVHNSWCHHHAIRFDPEALWKLRNPSRFVPRSWSCSAWDLGKGRKWDQPSRVGWEQLWW